MDPTQKSKLEKWIRSQVLILDDDRGRCTKFVLRHVAAGRFGAEVLSLKVPKKDPTESWPGEAANEVETRITDDAEGIGSGVQTYVLLPYFENKPDKPIGRFTFRETPSSMEDPEDTESEPPTKTGVLSQMMRHTEAATRLSLMSMGQIISTLRHTNARQAETIEKLVEEKMESLSLMERLRSEEMERKLVLRREENKEKLHADMFEKVSTLLPVVVNRIAGKNLLPSAQTPVENMVKGLVESITPEQIEGLQKVFRPDQLVALMEVFQSLQPPETVPQNGASMQHLPERQNQ